MAQNLGLRSKRFPATLVLGVMLSLVVGEVPQSWAQEPFCGAGVGDCSPEPSIIPENTACEGMDCVPQNDKGAGTGDLPCLEGDRGCDYERTDLGETSECEGIDCASADNEEARTDSRDSGEEDKDCWIISIAKCGGDISRFAGQVFGIFGPEVELDHMTDDFVEDSECDDELGDCTTQPILNTDVTITLPVPALGQPGLTYFSFPGEGGESSSGITIIQQPPPQSTSILQYEEGLNFTDLSGFPILNTQNAGSFDIACPGQKESEVATLGPNDPPAQFRISLRCLCHQSMAKVQNSWNHINEKVQGVVAAAKGQTATGQSFNPPSPAAQPAVFEAINQSLEGFNTKTLVSDLMQTYNLSAGGIIVVKAKKPKIVDKEKQYCLDGKGIIDLVQAMEPTKKKGLEQLKQARAGWNAEQKGKPK